MSIDSITNGDKNILLLVNPDDIREVIASIIENSFEQLVQPNGEPDQMLTIMEICKRFGKTKPTMYRFLKEHNIKRHYILRTPYVKLDDILGAMSGE